MKAIGEQLRRAREARGRTLEEIAAATRINRKHLEQLEGGVIPDLPLTYLRAFIKAYAQEVGMNSTGLLKQLETGESNNSSEQTSHQSIAKLEHPKTRQLNILFSLSLMISIGLAILIFWMRNNNSTQRIQEISFGEVVKSKEQNQLSDQGPFSLNVPLEGAKADSLSLEGIASESVWVRIVVDGVHAKEYRLAPFNRIRLKSKNYFSLSLDNARAISFSLNGLKLGELSPKEAIPAKIRKALWNITLSWDSIRKLQSNAGG